MEKHAIAHLATLARLSPDEAAQERFARQCGDILQYMEILNGVDTSGVEPMYSPFDAQEEGLALRPDAAVERSCREELLAGAPQSDGTFFVVPRIV